MPRYFIEVAYDGTRYGGFQIQKNANTIQQEVTHALETFYKTPFTLTGSSRTDRGVHAEQNFFHFDFPNEIQNVDKNVYNLNAILPGDIVVKKLFMVADNAHCRFDAVSREYHYFIYSKKNPFIRNTAFFYPYKLDLNNMNEAANLLLKYEDFSSFSKRNTQVKNFNCQILKSEWKYRGDVLVYEVEANRFLRGMVKGLVGTMLRVGRLQLTVGGFREIIESGDCRKADFSIAAKGLFLMKVRFQ